MSGHFLSLLQQLLQSWLLLFAAATISKLLELCLVLVLEMKLLVLKELLFTPPLDNLAEHSLRSALLLLSLILIYLQTAHIAPPLATCSTDERLMSSCCEVVLGAVVVVFITST